MQVMGEYLNLPGTDEPSLSVSITDPAEGSLVSGTVEIVASAVGTVTVDGAPRSGGRTHQGIDVFAEKMTRCWRWPTGWWRRWVRGSWAATT